MDFEKLNVVQNRQGFIAALDQSGGSTAKTLKKYGIEESEYQTEEEMFDLIHEMRKRVFTSNVFQGDKILGCILFYKTMNSKVEKEYTADYLWNQKKIVSFLKVDKGLEEEDNGVRLMKEIPDLEKQLKEANQFHVFGTKMRSVILSSNRLGIHSVVKQQFELAKKICEDGLVPIIEPEVDINISDKKEAEEILKEEIIEVLRTWDPKNYIMFKFTIPSTPDFYHDLLQYSFVIRIVALSGGYELEEACQLLKKNHQMIASFSRALLQDLNVKQTEEEFDEKLSSAIEKIYDASIS